MKEEFLKDLAEAASFVRARQRGKPPRVGVILGSGLASSVPELENLATLPYSEIPGFPAPTVAGHHGRLILGERGPLGVAVLQGRFHYYEGIAMERISMPVRLLKELGVGTVILTAAVGSLKKSVRPGHLVFIRDHLNFMGINPLKGMHTSEFGPDMFPDLSGAYTPSLRKQALALCRRLKIKAGEGVYTAVAGPSFETPAEIRAFAKLGGSVVGMSMITESIVARQVGMDILALGWIANMAAGLSKEPLTHAEVLKLGERMAVETRAFLEAFLDQFGGRSR
jgi:purine-nucleoside phosphorylase